MSRPSASTRVGRRHVFYVSGFDPKGPAHYHRLYTDEAAVAGAVGGYNTTVGKRRKLSEHSAGWSVHYRATAGDESAEVNTEVEFLRWDDIVRDHWPRHPGVLAADLVKTTWLYLRTGALWRMYTLSWPPVVALVVPFLILLALVLALPLAALVGGWTGRSAWAAGAHPLASWALGLAVASGLFGLAFAGARLAEKRLNMQWLLRSYAFTGRQGTTGWPVLETRLDAFARAISERVSLAAKGQSKLPDSPSSDEACDEVLIVAHSSGSIMAVAALARAMLLDPQLTQRGPRVSLLTLGHWTPLLSSLPGAHGFRAELDRLARDPELDWVDFTAPPDGCCFALTDPITAAGLAPAERANHPRLLSPRFASLFSPSRYASIKRDRFHLHFQYLMASELPGDYDYTAITAGPQTLGARFASQPSVTDFEQFRSFQRKPPPSPTPSHGQPR